MTKHVFVAALAALTAGGGALTLTACSEVQMRLPPPDDVYEGGAQNGKCPLAPKVICERDAGPGAPCNGDPDAESPVERLIPQDAQVPFGCYVNLRDPVPNDYNECLVHATCTCGAPVDGGSPWVCLR